MRMLIPSLPFTAALAVTIPAVSWPQAALPPPPAAQVPQGGAEVPLRLVDRRPLLDVRVNGRGPYTFALDTGASGFARADASLVTALTLPVVGEARGSAGPGAAATTMPIVRFDTLQLGAVTFSAVDAPSRDYNLRGGHIDGIVALNLFAEYLVTLDFPRGVLRIASGELPPPDGREVFAFDGQRRIAQIPIRVAGTEVAADIDTGAMGGLTLPASLAGTLRLAAPPVPVGSAMTVSGPIELSGAALQGDVSIGRYLLTQPWAEFTPAFAHANVGIDVLSRFALTFDQKNRRLRLAREGTAPIVLQRQARPGGA
jgi:hypothetical protein